MRIAGMDLTLAPFSAWPIPVPQPHIPAVSATPPSEGGDETARQAALPRPTHVERKADAPEESARPVSQERDAQVDKALYEQIAKTMEAMFNVTVSVVDPHDLRFQSTGDIAALVAESLPNDSGRPMLLVTRAVEASADARETRGFGGVEDLTPPPRTLDVRA